MSASPAPGRTVRVAPGRDELFETAARRFVAAVGETLGRAERAGVCLSGGATPEDFYKLLASPPFVDRVAWERLDYFWGDERCVAIADRRSNYRMAHEALLSHLALDPACVHRIPAELGSAEAAGRYELELIRHFGGRPAAPEPPRFDVLLLGLGADGHTASLFPDHAALRVEDHWVAPVDLPDGVSRVTLTLPVLNAAQRVFFLVAGEDKAIAVRQVLSGNGEPRSWPARLVHPPGGEVQWFLDAAAASRLND